VLVDHGELVDVTLSWYDMNQRLTEELKGVRKLRRNLKKPDPEEQKAAQAIYDALPPRCREILEGGRLKSAAQNMCINQDALLRIKMDIVPESQLRDRRQLEQILLHLLDAVRCNTDASDVLHDYKDAKAQGRRRKREEAAPSSSFLGKEEGAGDKEEKEETPGKESGEAEEKTGGGLDAAAVASSSVPLE